MKQFNFFDVGDYIGSIHRVTDFCFLFHSHFFKESWWLEFDFSGKCGVDGINLLISNSSYDLWGLFPSEK